MRIDGVRTVGSSVRLDAHTVDGPSPCPNCATPSSRAHSRYHRHLADTATAAQEVLIRLRVRRLFCDNPDCAKTTFAEQVPELTAPYARRTPVLRRALTAIALALGGRAGARLTRHLATSVSRMTLLRILRGLPDPDHPTPKVLGVDDFALRRGHHYGTLLVDIETHRPVDVLTDRTAQTLADWLRVRPGVQIVCRDRATAYADGARSGAPDAIQVADRWHIWHNLADAVERTVARHHDRLAAALAVQTETETDTDGDGDPQSPNPDAPADRTDRWAVRARERHTAVHALLAEGVALKEICRQLGLSRGTVRRFARAETVEELLTHNGTGHRASILEPFKPYLRQRWNEGCTNATALFSELTARGYRGGQNLVRHYLHQFSELTARGYRGGQNLVRHYLHQFRVTASIPRPAGKPPAVRRFVSWIMTDPPNMDETDQRRLDAILAASPHLTALVGHVRTFADMMCSRRGQELEAWMAAVDADDEPALRSFVRGLRSDHDAVTAGLTLPWSSGIVEGHVNRIKMLKRQMFGRAKPDLLRKRVLLTD